MSEPSAMARNVAEAKEHLAAGDLEAAGLSCAEAMACSPQSPEPLRVLARVLLASGSVPGAVRILKLAGRIAPGNLAVQSELGTLLLSVGRHEEALTALELGDPADPAATMNFGLALRACGRLDEALTMLHEAVRLDASSSIAWANLASALEAANRNADARAAALRALSLAPDQPLASLVLASLDKVDGHLAEARARLQAVLRGDVAGRLRGDVEIELGHVLDRMGLYDQAFEAYAAGQAVCGRQPESRALDRAHFPELVCRLTFFAEDEAGHPAPDVPDRIPAPAFLVGFPRSGTTLVEQLLAAHPAVTTMSEQEVLTDLVRAAPGLLDRPFDYPADLRGLTSDERSSLRAHWWALAEARLGGPPEDRLLVDKLPLNLVHLAFIRRIFPEARVVVVLRDPRDCCLSAFAQSFAPTVAMVHFDSLEGTAALYRRVMEGWLAARRMPGLDYLELRYEALVDDLHGEAGRLLTFLGLPWDPAVTRYHEQARGRTIRTPSHQDVCQPIYRRSRQRWRNYAGRLAPVQGELEPLVRALGYPLD